MKAIADETLRGGGGRMVVKGDSFEGRDLGLKDAEVKVLIERGKASAAGPPAESDGGEAKADNKGKQGE